MGRYDGALRQAEGERVTRMEYAITFADVMSAVITIGIGFIGWYVKRSIDKREARDAELEERIAEGNASIRGQIEKNNEKINERIDRLEARTEGEIQRINKEISNIKGDFATTFVLREDFFRSMNGVEDKIRGIDGKIDRLLLLNGNKQ